MSRGRRDTAVLHLAFVLSGAAGLVYEVVWSRYLALLLGHGALAQVVVLMVYLGGMAVGAHLVADLSRRIRRPLLAYAGVEGALALAGLAFHPVYLAATSTAYDRIFPWLADPSWVGAVRWGLAALLVLPPAVLLGATFPLMAAGLVRGDPTRPGRGVATAYLANALGGAGGVLLAGFGFVAWFGLDGALRAAAVLNLAAAALVAALPLARRSTAPLADGGGPAAAAAAADGAARPLAPDSSGSAGAFPVPMLLTVAAGTAMASFGYEIAWIRMLSLLMGSATHAFELMLSAFILGLGLGAWFVRDLLDRTRSPFRLLGVVQVAMGVAALATLPVYVWSFPAMGALLGSLPGMQMGYALVNLSRYALGLLVMLPATFLAGMTLPALVTLLLRGGRGEGTIGRVYALNTAGSVAGAFAAGMVLLPWLGLKGLLAAAAAVDILLGAWVLRWAARRGEVRHGVVVAAALLAVGLPAFVGFGTTLDRALLTSGIYRYGRLVDEEARPILFYRDGRTATVAVHVRADNGLTVLTTNGKPDASLDARWYAPRRDTLPDEPIPPLRDALTQVMAPLVALAHRPDAVGAANVGHGSGMSGSTLLSGPALERLTTIEIEPAMVDGSFSFLPVNRRVFDDPRSVFVFDDARSYFAHRPGAFDLVFSEPSNPWVSGAASLFTTEFYERVRRVLAPGGVLGQWLQLYELDDGLFLSVLAAVDPVLPHYRVYLVGDADVLLVASEGPLGEADWSVASLPSLEEEILAGIPPLTADHLDGLLLFDEDFLRPLLPTVPVNSDFDPVLDLGAEAARLRGARVDGVLRMASSRWDLHRTRARIRRGPAPGFQLPPAAGLEPMVRRGRAAWLREVWAEGGGRAPEAYPEWQPSLERMAAFLDRLAAGEAPPNWIGWARDFGRVEADLHAGTAGWADSTFYARVRSYLDPLAPPPPVRAAVDFHHGLATWDFEEAARAADVLLQVGMGALPWMDRSTLVHGAVLAYLEVGRPASARLALDAFGPSRELWGDDLGMQLLEAWIRDAGR